MSDGTGKPIDMHRHHAAVERECLRLRARVRVLQQALSEAAEYVRDHPERANGTAAFAASHCLFNRLRDALQEREDIHADQA